MFRGGFIEVPRGRGFSSGVPIRYYAGTMVLRLLVLFFLLASFPVTGEAGDESPPKQLTLVALPIDSPVIIDGDLVEWSREQPVALDRSEQLNKWAGLSDRWGGGEDISAEIFIRHSAQALYLGGWVFDDDLRFHDVHWWLGDAVEVFLDTDLAGDRGENVFSDDDFQIFLMPHNPGRSWGVGFHGQRSVLGDDRFVGVQVVHQPFVGGYVFEAVLPLVNFSHYDGARKVLGFNLAISDYDLLPEGEQRRNYITINGQKNIFREPWNMCRLELRGEPWAGRGIASGSQTFGIVLSLLIVILAIVVVTLFSVKIYNAAQKHFPRWRGYGVGLFFFFMFVIVTVPPLVVRWRLQSLESLLETGSRDVDAFMRQLCSPGVETGRGGIRTPATLTGLLSGGRVPIAEDFHYTILDLSSPQAEKRSAAGTPFLPYDVALDPGKHCELDCGGDGAIEVIAVALHADFREPFAEGVAPDGVIRKALAVEIVSAEGMRQPVAILDLIDGSAGDPARLPELCAPAWSVDGETWHEYRVVLPECVLRDDVAALTLTLVNPNVDVRLAGATGLGTASGAIPDVSPPGAPTFFYLGNRTLTGVPTWLRDGFMPPGSERPIESIEGTWETKKAKALALNVPGAPDALFLVYTSRDVTLFEKDKYGAEVARVILRLQDGTELSRSILAGVHLDHWTRDHPEDMESDVAYRWSVAGGTRHLDVLRIDLDRANPLESVSLVNTDADGTSLVLCAATVGYRVEREPLGTGLLREEGDALFLEPSLSDRTRRLDWTVFHRGVAQASSHEPQITERLLGTSIADEVRALAPSLDFVPSPAFPFQAGGTRFLGLLIALPGHDGERLLVRGAVEIEPLTTFAAVQNTLTTLAVILFLPFFIMFFVDLLGRLQIIRLKLTSLFILTSVVPIVILSLLMFDSLSRLQDERNKEHLLGTVEIAKERLAGLVDEARATGRSLLASSELLSLVNADQLDEQAISATLRRWITERAPDDGLERAARLEIELVSGERRLCYSGRGHVHSYLFDDTESGLYFRWGGVYFMGTAGRDEFPRLRLSIAGRLSPAYLKTLCGQLGCEGLVIRDLATGYPAADAGLPASATDHRLLVRSIAAWIEERKEPYVGEASGGILVSCDFLAVRGERVVVEAQKVREGILLPVAFLRAQLDVNDLFLIFGAIILACAIFIGSVVTESITNPIEELKKGAAAVSRGDLRYRLNEESGDELGRLAGVFNSMTGELDQRLEVLRRLTRNTKELSAGLDLPAKIESALAMLLRDLNGERAVLFLYDRQMGRFNAAGDTDDRDRLSPEPIVPGGGFLKESLRCREPQVFHRVQVTPLFEEINQAERTVVAPEQPLVLLPLPLGQAIQGTILVVLPAKGENRLCLNLDYLSSMAHQIAVALENARLYQLAIQDPDTGFYLRAFFRHRLAEELDRTVHNQGRLALLRLSCDGVDRLKQEAPTSADEVIAAMVGVIRQICRDMYIVGHGQAGSFDILLPDADSSVALQLERALVEQTAAAIPTALESSIRLDSGVACCPEDATSMEFLFDALKLSIEMRRAEREAGGAGPRSGAPSFPAVIEQAGFVFQSPKMLAILSDIERIADSSASVLLLGETGVGKEVAAEIIHRRSQRAGFLLVRLNCSALAESILESELFGHEKGAFTGAERRKAGHFEVAHEGTLFLDEVADLSLRTQAKLLRVLQDKTFEPLGSSGHPRTVDVRIVAATNRDLSREIERGTFRPDLYFRLKLIVFTIPPLRERKAEIPHLVRRFIDDFNSQNRRHVTQLSPAALDKCYRYSWPGNVRELKNVLNRAMLLAESDQIEPVDLIFEAAPSQISSPAPGAPSQAELAVGGGAKLNERQTRLLAHLQRHASITNRQYIEMMGISARTGLRDLQELIKLDLIVRRGSRRAAVYQLK